MLLYNELEKALALSFEDLNPTNAIAIIAGAILVLVLKSVV